MNIQAHLPHSLLALSFMLGLGLACVEEPAMEPDCTPGTEGCECTIEGSCFGTLECYSGLCIMGPGNGDGETGNGNGDGDSGDGDGDSGDGDSGDGDGDSGDGDSGDGDACIQSYNSCWDFDAGEVFGSCCPGMICLYDNLSIVSGCVPECELHSECATDCCVLAEGGNNFCSPTTAICNDNGKCIDTCMYANDGECDDGGPGADWNFCEYGTDCGDCGPRY